MRPAPTTSLRSPRSPPADALTPFGAATARARPGAVAWTPETALLALALAGNGDHEDADRLLTFLDSYRTPLGSLPEKVDSEATPASVAPLAWTSSLVLLTLAELEDGLPVVPAAH
ncbi:hypothetical protein [Jiangella endophytica]|uniref:hypothetical protein n=1 Tax=Jiangella endophytica TaxID=1623398 RepID=UPI000E3467E5|nr:hypothetical protein [Jiangella endophytica]